MKRRDVISLVGGAAALGPFAASAQRPQETRRLGIIMAAGQSAEYLAALETFAQVLGSLGWSRGSNLLIDVRWSAGDRTRAEAAAKDIAALRPDVILGQSTAVISAVRAATPTTPVVFVHVPDPVAAGFVASLARPGGNVTGFTNIEPSIGGKWLQLLAEMAPDMTRASMLVNPDTQADRGALFVRPFEAAARALHVTPVRGEVRSEADIEATMAALAGRPRGGVVVIPDAFFAGHSTEIVALAARLRLPAVFPYRYYVAQGGLMCYGVDNVELFRQAAPYVDRLLRGTKPADLPVQLPTRFELVLNMKTARALGLTVPASILARADQLVE